MAHLTLWADNRKMTHNWLPDLLGDPFEQITIDLGEDEEGPLVATLVRSLPSLDAGNAETTPGPSTSSARPSGARPPALPDVDVLYVHGWSDFFFQTDLAEYWNALGARFYALDLRKYGRSLRPGQTPGYIDDLGKYDLEISAALRLMGTKEAHRRLVLFGHSTGGLTLTLWASRHEGLASALVLNSPWFEFQGGSTVRHALMPLVRLHADRNPKSVYPETDFGYYTKAQKMVGTLPSGVGDPKWRPEHGFPTRPGWLHAIMAGQEKLTAHDLDVGMPSLVLLSASATPWYSWSAQKTDTDSVLVVDDIAKVSAHIFPEVTIARLKGALHDVFLSHQEVRVKAYNIMGNWLLGGALNPPAGLPAPPASPAR